MYQLDIILRRGTNLAARDRRGKNMFTNCSNIASFLKTEMSLINNNTAITLLYIFCNDNFPLNIRILLVLNYCLATYKIDG